MAIRCRETLSITFTPSTLLAAALLGIFCILADHLLTIPEINKVPILKALTDSFTHGIVGLLTWAIVMYRIHSSRRRYAIEVMLCGIAACLIDLDHFIAAGSLKLKDATHLSSRPPLHDTALILVIILLLFLIIYLAPLTKYNIYTLPLLFLAAWLSHHVRDGTRRGLWMRPIGTTPPIPYRMYVGSIVMLPFLWRFIVVICRKDSRQRDIHLV